MSPGSILSWDGVSSPPDWNGSCLTSPSSAPAWVPVASMNGGRSPGSWPTRSLGTMAVSLGAWPGPLKRIRIRNAAIMAMSAMVRLLNRIAPRTPSRTSPRHA